MKRVNDPQIREKQILAAAMRLFYERGFENTSMTDIAREVGVVKGLCYRYFDSKQTLFQTAVDEYAAECCQDFLGILHDQSRKISGRLNDILALMTAPQERGRYHEYFHKPGNEMMHELVGVKMCEYMIPHLEDEIRELRKEKIYCSKNEKIDCTKKEKRDCPKKAEIRDLKKEEINGPENAEAVCRGKDMRLDAGVTARYLMYGLLGLWQGNISVSEDAVHLHRALIDKLLDL